MSRSALAFLWNLRLELAATLAVAFAICLLERFPVPVLQDAVVALPIAAVLVFVTREDVREVRRLYSAVKNRRAASRNDAHKPEPYEGLALRSPASPARNPVPNDRHYRP